ncbi:CLUMA_CG000858, isoform A [Clunio marinus]|uniref:CLUMA_CG000858, isoform A n=1 Tax=Clunio marinus TaxID=568069 RepID=A0A1J1HHR2_9DIPT|nr:CLUMA_CG000858, isoform A [Clunio marinus]
MNTPDDSCDTLIEEVEIVDSRENRQNVNLGIEHNNIVTKNQDQRSTGAIPKYSTQSALLKPKFDYIPRNYHSVVNMIKQGYYVCVIMRGLPGSGKSFLAHRIIEDTIGLENDPDNHIISADKYFIKRNGFYKFEPEKLPEAHQFTQTLFTQSAANGLSPIIVDNTNVCYWEMYYYMQVAVQYGYHIEIMEPNTPWKFFEGKLATKNQHSVSYEKLKKMKSNYQNGLSVNQLLKSINLEPVKHPKMRKKLAQEKEETNFSDLITFDDEAPKTVSEEEKTSKEQESEEFKEISQEKVSIPSTTELEESFLNSLNVKPKENLQPEVTNSSQKQQQKQNKNKQAADMKLAPHKSNCPNENASFAQIRELYPNVNDSYLWDFFERCNGDADWCVNLLCDENLTNEMKSGNELTCTCFTIKDTGNGGKKVKSNGVEKTNESKKASKQIDLSHWLETKEMIEKSITIGSEHYPDHVNEVKSWKKGPQESLGPPIINEFLPPEETKTISLPNSPVDSEELYALPIAENLIFELDERFGGGMLKSIIKPNHKFPPKIFITQSTAHKLYLEVMEAFYSQEAEEKLQTLKDDEELAKKLHEQEESKQNKSAKRNGNSKTLTIENFKEFETNSQSSQWKKPGKGKEESDDDIALRISKEKLIEIFPELNKNDLMEIFAGTNYNFNDTVDMIQDSLGCKKEEREQIAASQKKIFNAPWKEESKENDEVLYPDVEFSAYTSEHLKKIEELRQEVKECMEEQKLLLEKAKSAHLNKNFDLAIYLSNMALLQKQKAEEAKHTVANMIAGIHEKTQSSNTTVDLHFMNLVEAVIVLDTFLDKNISRLRAIKKPYEDLFIITGRGNHSHNGVANIKNKTKTRLRERSLTSTEANPGLLKVKIFRNSKLSAEI